MFLLLNANECLPWVHSWELALWAILWSHGMLHMFVQVLWVVHFERSVCDPSSGLEFSWQGCCSVFSLIVFVHVSCNTCLSLKVASFLGCSFYMFAWVGLLEFLFLRGVVYGLPVALRNCACDLICFSRTGLRFLATILGPCCVCGSASHDLLVLILLQKVGGRLFFVLWVVRLVVCFPLALIVAEVCDLSRGHATSSVCENCFWWNGLIHWFRNGCG